MANFWNKIKEGCIKAFNWCKDKCIMAYSWCKDKCVKAYSWCKEKLSKVNWKIVWDKTTTGLLIFLMCIPFLILGYIVLWFVFK